MTLINTLAGQLDDIWTIKNKTEIITWAFFEAKFYAKLNIKGKPQCVITNDFKHLINCWIFINAFWETQLNGRSLQSISVKVLKTAIILNYFECYFIYAKVCKVYYICLFWLRDFENARAGRKVTLIVRFIFC